MFSDVAFAAKLTDKEHTRIDEPRPADVPSDAELEAHFDWIKELPFGDMCRFRWVKEQKSKASTVAELLRENGPAYCVELVVGVVPFVV